MMYTSLAVLALSASAAISPLSYLSHMHVHPKLADGRYSVTLHNKSTQFRDVKVDGKTYTVPHDHTLTIKAPEGTGVYAASRTPYYQRGELMLKLAPKLDGQTINFN